MNNIPNQKVYLERMSAAMKEKLFFLDNIDIANYDIILDFGCADGTLIDHLLKVHPSAHYIGYDHNIDLIHIAADKQYAKEEWPDVLHSPLYTYKWAEVQSTIDQLDDYYLDNCAHYPQVLVICSSVLHELDSRGPFWIATLMSVADCFVVRDMYGDDIPDYMNNTYTSCLQYILSHFTREQLDTFEMFLGPIASTKQVYRLLLMNEFIENWGNECQEDYFSGAWKTIENIVRHNNYLKFPSYYWDTIVDDKYTLPYRKQQVLDKFKFDMTLPTHRNLILVKSY